MKLSIDQALLLKELQRVVSIIPSRSTYPVLTNLLITSEPSLKGVSISATDLEIYLKKTILLGVEGLTPESVIVQGRKLLELVRVLEGERIVLTSEENRIVIEGGPTRAVMPGLDPAEYPEPLEFPNQISFRLSSRVVGELFRSTAFAVSRDESRPAMCGILWELKAGELRMVATDGHRLALIRRQAGSILSEQIEPFGVIVPAKVFNHLPDEGVELTIGLDFQKIGFDSNACTVIARLIEGPYPDYERVIPPPSENRLIIGTKALTAGVRRVSLFSDTVTRTLRFRLSTNSLRLYAATSDLGEAEERLDCLYDGREMEIGYNASYLLDILRRVDSEEVVFELTTPLSAAAIRPKEQPAEAEQLFLLMPIRLD